MSMRESAHVLPDPPEEFQASPSDFQALTIGKGDYQAPADWNAFQNAKKVDSEQKSEAQICNVSIHTPLNVDSVSLSAPSRVDANKNTANFNSHVSCDSTAACNDGSIGAAAKARVASCGVTEAEAKDETDEVENLNVNKDKRSINSVNFVDDYVRGIKNYGNSCFMSAGLQGLGSLFPRFADTLTSAHRDACSRPCTACVLHPYLRELNVDGSVPLEPARLFSSLREFGMAPGEQQDCHEFLSKVFEKLEIVLHARKISDVLGIPIVSSAKCLSCGETRETAEKSWILSLNVERTVPQSLKKFTAKEVVSGPDAVFCRGKCLRKTAHEKQLRLDENSLPPSMILHFKRFTNSLKKYRRNVKLSKVWNFGAKYFLAAVVEHIGNSIQSGHYVTYKVDKHGRWWRISDHSCSVVSFQTVQKVDAYLAFYNKKMPSSTISRKRKHDSGSETKQARKKQANTLSQQRHRSLETSEQRQERLKLDKQRKQQKRKSETFAERARRLNDQSRRRSTKRKKSQLHDLQSTSKKQKKQTSILRISTHGSVKEMLRALKPFDCGSLDQKCPDCGSYNFSGEALKTRRKGENIFSICCGHGRVKLERPRPIPMILKKLLLKRCSESRQFFENIRAINSLLAFASLAVTDASIHANGRAPGTFRIQGQLYHRVGTLLPEAGDVPKFLSLYIHDAENELENRAKQHKQSHKFEKVLKQLQKMMHEENPFVEVFKTGLERLNEAEKKENAEMVLVLKADPSPKLGHKRTLNKPTAKSEIAAIIPSEGLGGSDEAKRALIVAKKNGPLRAIHPTHQFYDALHYVLFFPKGDTGWSLNIPGQANSEKKTSKQPRRVSMREYYAYRCMQRVPSGLSTEQLIKADEFPTILLGKKLLQQFGVDVFSRIEQDRLQYQRLNQKKLRADLYQGLADAVASDDHKNAGKRIILSSSFANGPRSRFEKYQDAMAVARKSGNVDLFITATANPKWAEITRNLLPGQTPTDVPHLIARAFNIRKKQLLETLKTGFGRAVASVHVIEFQKRGLPHAHILLFLDEKSKCKAPEQYDDIISAEIPEEGSELRELVLKHMIHGPCGPEFPWQPCMKNGKCTKGFPKDFCNETKDNGNGYPIYRRRSPENGGFTAKAKVWTPQGYTERTIDNRWVVPYNPGLLHLMKAHINVEWAGSIKCCKYVFKYVTKGSDKIVFRVECPEGKHDSRDIEAPQNVDEIEEYLVARYLSASEAFWRLFEFPMSSCEPSVQRLAVHLENQQYTVFNPDDNKEEAEARLQRSEKTTLTEWMKINLQEHQTPLSDDVLLDKKTKQILPRASEVMYPDFVKYYAWNITKKSWSRRKAPKFSNTIGRVYSVPVTQGERYYLRRLLYHVPGAKSFADLRTVNTESGPKVCETFKEACSELGLLQSDKEWENALEEADFTAMPHQLRSLFLTIILHCNPENPMKLWENFSTKLSADHHRRLEREFPMQNVEQMATDAALRDLADEWIGQGKQMKDFPLPTPASEVDSRDTFMREVNEQLGYVPEKSAKKAQDRILKFNKDQTQFFSAFNSELDAQQKGRNVFFLNAAGGTGKTFVLNTLLAHVRGRSEIAIGVAASGIASLLLEGGRTVHSRFKVPLELDENTFCGITKRKNATLELLKRTRLIVWDEISMQHRHVVECVDRSLRDLLENDEPFGGIIVVFGGDWRQILPVVKRGNKADILDATLKHSKLWKCIRTFALEENMRVKLYGTDDEKRFLEFTKRLGTGESNKSDSEPFVKIPASMIAKSHCIRDFFTEIYDNMDVNFKTAEYFQKRAILAPKNEHVDEINKLGLDSFPGKEFPPALSADTLSDEDNADNFPTEYLNSLTPNGMPPHEFRAKPYVPGSLLRNIRFKDGLCNGTRLIILKVSKYVVEAIIIAEKSSEFNGKKVYIPRIPMTPAKGHYPFALTRRQFPIRLAFGMTINKAQGQTLEKIGLYLPTPVFAHGQLYVASTRVGSEQHIKIMMDTDKTISHGKTSDHEFMTHNVVYKEILSKSRK